MEQSLGQGKKAETPRGARFGVWGALLVSLSLSSLACGGRTEKAAVCEPLTGCGGDLVGTWDVTSMCVRVLDGAQVPSAVPECEPVTRHALDVAVVVPKDMTVAFTKSTYLRTGTASMDTRYVFTDACLAANGYDVASKDTCDQVGFGLQMTSTFNGLTFTPITVSCNLDSAACACDVSGEVAASDSGGYRVSNSEIFFDNLATGGTYCARDDKALISTDSASTTERIGLKRR
jgi:hypothetical protein